MDERGQSTFKSKIRGTVQEVIFPDFPDDDNTTTTTVTKSRRVSFGSNFVKEFIVGSAVSAQCVSEYEQAFSSSDSSNANSSHSAVESGILSQNTYVLEESHKMNQSVPMDVEESHNKRPKISSTICFSADSPTDDMEFTEGCISLAKHILDKKNKEMTVIIQAKPKESKDEMKLNKDEETQFFDGSNFDMSMTKCFKSKNNKKIEKKFQVEKTRIFSKCDDEMSITRCDKVLSVQESDMVSDDESNNSWEKDDCKENQMPLDLIMHHLDKDSSDIDKFLFNPEKTLSDVLKANLFETFESEKLNLNESMDISRDFQPNLMKNLQCSDIKGESKSLELNSDESNEIISQKENSGEDNVSMEKEEDSFLEELVSGANLVEPKEVQEEMEITFAKEVNSDVTFASPVEITQELALGKNSHILEELISREEEMEECVPGMCEDSVEDVTEGSFMRSEKMAEELSEEQLEESSTKNRLISQDKDEENVALDMCVCRKEADKSEEKLEGNLSGENLIDDEKGNHFAGGEIAMEDRNETIHKEIDSAEELMMEESLPKVQNLEKEVEKNSKDQVDSSETMEESIGKIICDGERIEKSVSGEDHEEMEADAPEVDGKMEEMSFEKIVREQNISVKSLPRDEKIDEDHNTKNIHVDMSLTKVRTNESLAVDSNDQPEMEKPEETMNGREEPVEQAREEESEVVSPCKSEISASEFLELADEGVDMLEKPTPGCDSPAGPEENEKAKDNQSSSSLMNTKVIENLEEQLKEPGCSEENEKANDNQPSLSLMDTKVIENLKEQSKEPGCIWKFKDFDYPTEQSLEFSFELLESSMTVKFSLKSSEEDTIDACCTVSTSEMRLDEEKQFRLPEYKLVIDFGFEKLKKNFKEDRKNVKTIRHVPYFLDQMNIFTLKINACLQQVLSILTLYPGSGLSGSILSFRLFSFPVFFSCTVSIDLTELYRLSSSSLSFDVDLGSLDKNKIRDIFQECLKCDNSLCEFVIRSTKYIIGLERETGCVSKRGHIRLLPADCH